MTERELCECHHIQKLERNGHTASCNRNHRKSLTDSQKAEQKKAAKPKRIDNVGTKNTFKCSDGTRVTQKYINEMRSHTYELMETVNPSIHCEGCLSEIAQGHAHIIPQARLKVIGKTELIWDGRCIFKACHECNAAIENPKGQAWKKLNNVERCMSFIAENDPELFIKFQLNSRLVDAIRDEVNKPKGIIDMSSITTTI